MHKDLIERNIFVNNIFGLFLLFLVLIFWIFNSANIFAEDLNKIEMKYTFDCPTIENIIIDGQNYSWVNMPNASNGGNAGEPALPTIGARILIPGGRDVSSVEIMCDDKILLGQDIRIAPVGPPIPLSTSPYDKQYIPKPNDSIYNSNQIFPPKKFENIGVQNFRGYKILILKIVPMEYLPLSGELYYYPEVKVIVNTEPSSRSNIMFRGKEEDISELKGKVDNYDAIKSYTGLSLPDRDNYELLILTNSGIADAFIPLKTFHDNEGIRTEIRSIDEIASDPGAVRDYIRDAYSNDGIDYVLIGGDDDVIAARDMYVSCWTYYTEVDMPVDLYFGCLDGTFDYDGDGQFGEPGDGENGGELDLIAEVYIGRAAVGNMDEAVRFVNKTLQYLNSSGTYDKKVLLCGEDLGADRPEDRRWGGEAVEQLVGKCEAAGYNTTGFSPMIYDLDRLYDHDWPNNYWPNSEIVARVNDNYHIIVHLGHSNQEYSLKLYSSETNQFNNGNLSFMYLQGCLAGHFDNYDCWAEQVTVKSDFGAFAAIANARLGWTEYWVYPYVIDGASQRYTREFWDAVLNPIEDKPQLGRANHDSKEDNLYRINEGAMRWCYYETNLFGDPAISIRRPFGINLEFPDGIPEIATPGTETIIRVDVVGLYEAVPVDGSGQLHYSLNGGDWQTVNMNVISSNQYEAHLPAISCGETLEYYFSAEEQTEGRKYYPDPSSPFNLIPADNSQIVFEDDFETDQDWSASGLWARGIPEGLGSFGTPDPNSGCEGPNVYGYNLSGDYENDLSETYLTSPPINCRLLTEVYFSYDRWLGVDDNIHGDFASIEVSNDGIGWSVIWENVHRITDVSWVEASFNITEIASGEETVYLRWVMGPTNSGFSYCGWNIDDVKVYGYECRTPICGDVNDDQDVNILDIVYLINYKYKSGPSPNSMELADVNSDQTVNILDIVYLINYKYKSGPAPICF